MSAGAAAGLALCVAVRSYAAEQIRQVAQREEEEMTQYSVEELASGWEFKIVRANTPAFRSPRVLWRVCEEERRAGWILVEKFDNSRLRFKRLVSAKAGDALLPFDPYRTHYGMGTALFTVLVAIVALLGAGVVFALLLAFD